MYHTDALVILDILTGLSYQGHRMEEAIYIVIASRLYWQLEGERTRTTANGLLLPMGKE